MALGTTEQREKAFFEVAFGNVSASLDKVMRLTTSRIMVTETAESAAMAHIENWAETIGKFKERILQDGLPELLKPDWTDPLVFPVALAAVASLESERVKSEVHAAVPVLLKQSDLHLDKGITTIGWQIRTFLARFFPDALGSSPLKTGLPATVDNKSLLLEYVDAVVGEVDEKTKLGYLQDTLRDIEKGGSDLSACLLIVERIIQHTKGTLPSPPSTG